MAPFGNMPKRDKGAVMAFLCKAPPAPAATVGYQEWKTPKMVALCDKAGLNAYTHYMAKVWRSSNFSEKRAELEADYAIALAAYRHRPDVRRNVTGLKEDEVLLLAGAVPEVLDLPGGGRVRVMRTAGGKYFNPKQLFDSKDAVIASLQPKKRAEPAADSGAAAPASKRAKIALPAAKELGTAAA